MVTEPTLDDAADYRFDNLYRVNWIEKLPDYQYQCLHLPFYQICDTFDGKSGKQSRQRRGPLATFATKSTTNPQNRQISAVVLIIRLFFVSVRPVEAFEWAAGGIVERGLGFQNVTLFGNAFYFLK